MLIAKTTLEPHDTTLDVQAADTQTDKYSEEHKKILSYTALNTGQAWHTRRDFFKSRKLRFPAATSQVPFQIALLCASRIAIAVPLRHDNVR
jgi:hypothetical protein